MKSTVQEETHAGDQDADSQAKASDRTSTILFSALGISMLIAALVLPFVFARRELSTGMSIFQVVLWLGFGFSWFFQGFLLGKSGFSFDPDDGFEDEGVSRWKEIVFYLLVFGPVTFGYVYVTFAHTGYFGFNYVLLFVLAGFSTLIFNFWVAFLYLVYQCCAWVVLAYFMFGRWSEIVGSVTMFSGYLFSAMMFFIFRRERRSRAKAFALSSSLDRANEQLRAAYRQAEELAATQERNRIAREIHDTIGHSLTVVNMQLETAKALIANDSEKALDFLDKAQSVTKKGLSDIRASVASLRASPLDGRSLAEAIEELLETSESGGLATRFELQGTPEKLGSAVEATLYRTVQEALTNVRKHASASTVDVSLCYEGEDRVDLSVSDDGKGCSEVEGGFGLIGIRERIQLLDGEVAFSTSPGKGFQLKVSVPR